MFLKGRKDQQLDEEMTTQNKQQFWLHHPCIEKCCINRTELASMHVKQLQLQSDRAVNMSSWILNYYHSDSRTSPGNNSCTISQKKIHRLKLLLDKRTIGNWKLPEESQNDQKNCLTFTEKNSIPLNIQLRVNRLASL